MDVRNSFLERGFLGNFRRCWMILLRFSGSMRCYHCQGLGTFRQGQWLLENQPRLRERSWTISSPKTSTAFLSFSEQHATVRNRCEVTSYVRDGPEAAKGPPLRLLRKSGLIIPNVNMKMLEKQKTTISTVEILWEEVRYGGGRCSHVTNDRTASIRPRT